MVAADRSNALQNKRTHLAADPFIVVGVLSRYSKDLGILQRLDRITRHLEKQGREVEQQPALLPRAPYQPHKLNQRLSDETVASILTAYQAGATTREVGQRFGLAHSSINKLLRRRGVILRRRGAHNRIE